MPWPSDPAATQPRNESPRPDPNCPPRDTYPSDN